MFKCELIPDGCPNDSEQICVTQICGMYQILEKKNLVNEVVNI